MIAFLYIKPFLIALTFSLILVKAVIEASKCTRKSSGRSDEVTDSKRVSFDSREFNLKEGGKNAPRFGGVAIILSFLLAIFLDGSLVFDSLKWGIVASSLLILFFGVYDDLRNLSWKKQLLGQAVVALVMIFAGLAVDYIANPFGGREFRLDLYKFSIFGFQFSVLSSLFVLFWTVGFMNVMNWLDGLDGLAAGVGFIGAIVLFLLSVSELVNQPPLGIISASLAGAILGFLLFNFHPAKVFMGTSGSMFLGFALAVIAVFSGGKIATAFLVMGFPILDAVWVVVQRVRSGHSPFKGDRRHLHYKLLERGWSQKKVVLTIYLICATFGVSALVFQSMGKILAFFALLILTVGVVFAMEASKQFTKRRS